MTRWMQRLVVRHLVPRRRLVKMLNAEREWRMASPSTLLDLHVKVTRLTGERDDARAEARGAKGALEAARRERDHEAWVASSHLDELLRVSAAMADLKRTGWAPPGMALVTYTPDHMVPGTGETTPNAARRTA
ncbi:MAG: hypothetical protein Q7V58_09625 [Actinomycetota bacterium]|nr:hypothetical protein [Actinomycetota bacterium]